MSYFPTWTSHVSDSPSQLTAKVTHPEATFESTAHCPSTAIEDTATVTIMSTQSLSAP